MNYTTVININSLIKKFMLKHFLSLLMFFNKCDIKIITHA